MRSYHSVLALSILLSAVACTEERAPTGPEATAAPELSATAAATLVFRAISGGEAHSCGVTTTNKAYCWGSDFVGALGDGGDFDSNVPVAVAGGLLFRNVSAGFRYSCGVTTTNKAYCWGEGNGKLGDGTTAFHDNPFPVTGGLNFRLVRAGINHTCGITTDDVAYCRGLNTKGQLGNFSHISRLAPAKVGAGCTGVGLVRGGITPAGLPHQQGLLLGIEHAGAAGDERRHLEVFPHCGLRRAFDPRHRLGRPLHLRGHHDQSGILLGHGLQWTAGRWDSDHPRRTSPRIRFAPVQERERRLILQLRYYQHRKGLLLGCECAGQPGRWHSQQPFDSDCHVRQYHVCPSQCRE